MASGTDFYLEHITRRGGTRLERVSASAANGDHVVAGMEIFFHDRLLDAVEP
jgi:hypothetical protein